MAMKTSSEGAHRLAISLAEVGKERVELRVDGFIDRGRDRPAVERRRRRNRHFRRTAGIGFDEFEMLDHRMAGEAELAGDLHAFIARRHRGKGDAGIHDVALDAVEAPQEIEMPPRAAKLAVGDRLQSGRLLLFDDVLDFAILDRLEFGGADLAFGALLARGFPRRRPQQAADMIGAKRRLCSVRHGFLLSRVMARLVPAIPPIFAPLCPHKRDHQDTALTRRPGDDESPLTLIPTLSPHCGGG